MMLEKSKNLLELSAKQLEIKSSLASSTMSGVWKPNVNVACSKVRYFRIQEELSKLKSNLIPFER